MDQQPKAKDVEDLYLVPRSIYQDIISHFAKVKNTTLGSYFIDGFSLLCWPITVVFQIIAQGSIKHIDLYIYLYIFNYFR